MANLFGMDLGINMPKFNFASAGHSLAITLVWLLVIFLFFAGVAVFIWLKFQNSLYNKKIIIFENIGNTGYRRTGEDSARLVKIGDGGEEILFLRKRKCYRTAYGKKMGDETYWFAIGQDGYWYNIVLGDLDAKMGMLDIEPIDRDMRYMHVAIRKNITERYRKINFMEKYGTMIANFIFLIIMLIGLWFLIDKLATATTQIISAMEANANTLELIKGALGNLDKVCSGGSGFAKA